MKRYFAFFSIVIALLIRPSGYAQAESLDQAIPDNSALPAVVMSEGAPEDPDIIDPLIDDFQSDTTFDEVDGHEGIGDSKTEQISDENMSEDGKPEASESDSESTEDTPSELDDVQNSEDNPSIQPDPEYDSEPESLVPSISDGIYVIRSLSAEREVLDVTGKSTKAGANVETWSSNGGGNQQWQISASNDGTVTLRSVLSGMLLDVSGAKASNGANVIQFPDNGGANQRWRIVETDGGMLITSALSDNLVLDISGAKQTDGGNIIVYAPNGGLNQLWEFVRLPDRVEPGTDIDEGWYRIESSEGVVLDVSGCSTKSGTNVELWTDNSGNNQAFYISCEDGYVSIATGTCGWLSSTGSDPISGSNVFQSNSNSSDSQRFALEDIGDGLWRFRNVANGFYLGADSDEKGMNVYSSVEGISFSLVPITSFIVEEGPYQILPAHASNRIVESVNPEQSAGMKIEIGSSYGSLHQKWFVEKVPELDNTYVIRSSASGLVLSASGRAVSLEREEEGSSAQQWAASPSGRFWVFENTLTGTVLDVTGQSSKDGALVGGWTQNGGDNQRFKLAPTVLFENGSVITISLGDDTDEVVDVNGFSKSNGASVTLWNGNGGANQLWRITGLGDGSYRLTNLHSGRLLTLSDNGTLTQRSATNGAVQQWFFSYDRSNGTVVIMTGSGEKLPLSASGTSDGSSIGVNSESDSPTSFRINVQYPYGQSLDSASSAQKRLASLAWKEPTTPSGWCALWVHNVFEAYGISDVYGNACDLYNEYCTSSNLYDLKVGMIVAVSRHPGTAGGRIYGHIGIYVGDGVMLDSSGEVRIWNVEDWINSYNGWVTPKWGWYGNRKLG